MIETGLGHLPEKYNESFVTLADRLQRLFGGNLVGFTAYGGWLHGDPFLDGEFVTSVVTLRKDDLVSLSNLACDGNRYVSKNVRAPYFMTEQYLKDSLDTFPVEFLEIQQTGRLLLGEDKFKGLKISSGSVRTQCERMLKSELIYLRQGLLRTGAISTMRAIFRPCALRLISVLAGVLYLHQAHSVKYDAKSIVNRCAEVTNIDLAGLRKFIENPPQRVGIGYYKQLYSEIGALSDYVDAHECVSAG